MNIKAACLLAGSFTICVLSACVAARETPSPAPDRKVEVIAAMDRYNRALLKMDADTLAAFYLPDGEALDNGRLIARGPKAIAKFLHSFDGVVRVDSYETNTESVTVEDDKATIIGTYEQKYTLLSNNQTGSVRGKYFADWVRQSNGMWLIQKMETRPLP